MAYGTQVLFIQGAGAQVHDAWDHRMVGDLTRRLGSGHEVRYPRMPQEDDPGRDSWSAAIRSELATLDDGAILVGHSVGGTILMATLSESSWEQAFASIILIDAPFVGAGGWSGAGFEFPPDLGARLPAGVPVHVFHGADDRAVPPPHADLYARAIPRAQVHRLPGRDHQLNDDLSEVAAVISSGHQQASDQE